MQPPQPAEEPVSAVPLVLGDLTLRRIHAVRHPCYQVATAGGLRVGLGRYSALNIYFFGRGQCIDLPSGERWRLTAVARGSNLAALVLNQARQRLAVAAAGAAAGNYGIMGRDYAYTLNPAEGGWGRSNLWELFAGEDPVARFTRRPAGGVCERPVPLPTVLLALLLSRFGIPGERELRMPSMWQGLRQGG